MPGLSDPMKEYLIISTVLVLLAVGLFITLNSGDVNLATRKGRQEFLDNLSSMVVRVIAYLTGLFMVQRLVGFPIEFPW